MCFVSHLKWDSINSMLVEGHSSSNPTAITHNCPNRDIGSSQTRQ